MKEKTYKASRAMSILCMALIAIPFFLSMWHVLTSDKVSVIAFGIIMGIILFLIFLMPLTSFRKTKYSLILGTKGLTYKPLAKQFGVDFVPWSVMKKATIGSLTRDCPIIKIQLLEGSFSEELKFPKGHKLLMGHSLFLQTNIIKGKPKDISDFINEAISESNN